MTPELLRLLVKWCSPATSHRLLLLSDTAVADLRPLTLLLDPAMEGPMLFVQAAWLEAVVAWADAGAPAGGAPQFAAHPVSAVLAKDAPPEEQPVLIPSPTPLLLDLCGQPAEGNLLVPHVGVKGNPHTFSMALLPQRLVMQAADGQQLAAVEVAAHAWAAPNQRASEAASTAAGALLALNAGIPLAQVRLEWGATLALVCLRIAPCLDLGSACSHSALVMPISATGCRLQPEYSCSSRPAAHSALPAGAASRPRGR